MIVRMVHPEHGATHVYDAGELERHRKYGWVPEGEVIAVVGNFSGGATGGEKRDEFSFVEAPIVPVEVVALPVVEAPTARSYERDGFVRAESLHEARDEGTPPKRKPGRPRKA
jgi:hypothetical protein